jgi:hypothetical protein
MSAPNPFEQAAIPTALAIIQALETLFTNIGTDPTQWPVKIDGAAKIFLGQVELQLPVLASAEAGAGITAIGTTLAGWTAKLKAAQLPAGQPVAPAA